MGFKIVKYALNIPRYNADIVLIGLRPRVVEMQEWAQIHYPALLHGMSTSVWQMKRRQVDGAEGSLKRFLVLQGWIDTAHYLKANDRGYLKPGLDV